ncbi:CAP domain-containing protein [Actinocorallia aurantiaca]|uniref:SCP domain-containing protein n=1 Tax=Actinocorallia aurantiaca TaxID=46204 RepID=A0ABN3UU67_9ACTN
MRHSRRLGKTAIATTGVVLSGLVATEASARSAPSTTTASAAQSCANSGLVHRPRSAFPNTAAGTAAYNIQLSSIRNAVFCLVNHERTTRNLKALTFNQRLYNAAQGHVQAAVTLKWWGPGRDPHVNPQTRKNTGDRVRDTGYLTGCRSFNYGENTYTGWGNAKVTPRAAVTWWMNSSGHRATILNRVFKETGVAVAPGSADRAAGSTTPAMTFVQVFGNCVR